MKSIRKYLFVMMAVAAVFAFVACGDDEDDDPTVIAMFGSTEYSKADCVVSFLSDGTFSVSDSDPAMVMLGAGTIMTGTYSGNPTQNDQTVKLTATAVNAVYDEYFTAGKDYNFKIDKDGDAVVRGNAYYSTYYYTFYFDRMF